MLMGTVISQDKYWVFFQDKGDVGQWNIESLLSPAAIDNRLSQGILPDESDFPVWPAYIRAVESIGAEHVNSSRWLNAISVRMRPEQLSAVSALPCVKEIRPVAVYAHTTGLEAACPEEPDTSSLQLSMLGLDWLHASGYDGRGVKIAVFDNGFFRVNELAAFAPLFTQNRILATRDYVDRDETLYHSCGHCRHGTYVFSILAADKSSGLTGSAPGASYILLRTENDSSETHREEDNWIAAAEFADSLGAQVFTTSLGYSVFDPGQGDYSFADLDGNTALITRAADMAAAKGIVVVNSAGNNGTDGLNAPADGDSVLAIASVDLCGQLSDFSSRGPSGDGRIKPDLAARGERTFYVNHQGVLLQGNGTSFSCPLISGLAACLIQAHPYAGASAI
ncbi:MAG: peptidase S8, partial [Bacteroidetes bacterium]